MFLLYLLCLFEFRDYNRTSKHRFQLLGPHFRKCVLQKNIEHMRRHSDPFSLGPSIADPSPQYPGPNERPNHALQSQRPRSPALESIANGPEKGAAMRIPGFRKCQGFNQ